MKTKIQKFINKFTLLFLAAGALTLGMTIKATLEHSNIEPSGDSVVQAQQPNNQNKPTPTPSNAQKPQYLPVTQSQNVQGIKFTASNFSAADNHVFVDVCYDLPGKDVWDINAAALQYGSFSTGDFAVSETSIDLAQGRPQNGYRCMRLDFYNLEPNADVSSLTLSIGNIGQIPPMEGHECEGYLARINSNARIAEKGIEAVCEQSPYGVQIKVAKNPQGIPAEEADRLISEAMFNQVNGPWVFTVTQNK
ncbi:MAG: hypothetical protein AB1509_02410 [Chloroflexota bacterium]